MRSFKNQQFPPTPQSGAVTWPALLSWMQAYQTQALAGADVRSESNDFAGAMYRDATGKVVLGADARLTGRVSSSLPTVLQRISDGGRAADQRFLYPVTVANRSSVQSANTVLTATSNASTATVNVAAHSVTFDFGTVAYSAGSVSGVAANTEHLIYCVDPDFAGGAVTYLATQNPENLMAAGVYYVGHITTPAVQSTFTVSAATSANPIAVTTAAAHGWATSDSVTFSAMPGDFAALNGNTYAITVTGASTFTVAVNGGAFAGYTSGGSVQRVVSSTQGGAGAAAGGGGDQAWLDFSLSF